jgi:hypothetical protein
VGIFNRTTGNVNAARVIFDSAEARTPAFFGSSSLIGDADAGPCPVTATMRHLGYSTEAVRTVLAYLAHEGTAAGCPALEPDDEAAVESAWRDPEADRLFFVPTPPAWRAAVPTPADARWAAAAFAN